MISDLAEADSEGDVLGAGAQRALQLVARREHGWVLVPLGDYVCASTATCDR